MIQAMVCSSVPMSGAMTSIRGPMIGRTSEVYRRVSRSSSPTLILVGSQAIPPLAPENGRFMIPTFHDIHIDRAATSPRSTWGAYRRPPLDAPLVIECWTR